MGVNITKEKSRLSVNHVQEDGIKGIHMFSTDEARQKCKLTREEFERAKNLRQDVVEFSDYYPEDCDSLDIIPKRLTKDIMYTLVKETVDKNSKKG